MSHDTNTSVLSYSYLAVLLLLAYVLASAPRYVRTFKENHNHIKIEKPAPLRQLMKYTKYYGIDPYVRVWNRLTPSNESRNIAGL